MRVFVRAGFLALFAGAAFGQSESTPKFEIADVHTSAKMANPFVRTAPPRNGRYEIKQATMLDLIRFAYGFNPDRIIGGPNWLELDRFDVVAKVPSGADADAQKPMLQSLLADRFKLVVKKDTVPVTTWVLAASKQPHLKEADGSGETGCKVTGSAVPPSEGGSILTMMAPDGKQTTINLGPGGTVEYSCRNMTMAAFAENLRTMMGVQVGPEPVIDETDLKGAWNFGVKWSAVIAFRGGEQITVADAIEKQLGLRLEQKPVSKEVVVVESVNRTPSPNPPGVSDALPSSPASSEFEVADVKLAAAATGMPMPIGMRMQPGGRFVCERCPLRMRLNRAFDTNNNEKFAGLPSWFDSVRMDITAKAPGDTVTGPGIDPQALAPMLRSLLTERFKLAYHEEQREMTAYTLISAKPKLKKADPESRIFCKRGPQPPNSPPGSTVLVCQNATMVMLADQLLNIYPGFNWPVLDATGIDGGWDFTFVFNPISAMLLNAPGRGGQTAGPDATPTAADPGGGYTIFEAIEKQLGLKLKTDKRPEPVIVIDHLEQKPTEN